MKRSLFVDSSAWYALADRDDPYHNHAASYLTESLAAYARLVTTNHVVGESYTLIRMRLGHAATQQFLKSLDHTHRLQRIFVVESQEEAAFALLRRYDDQDFSFVDATSFVVMKTLGLRDAFTFDKHFATAGFVAVPMAS
jgi:predicted nucleic acid-binding protein